MTDERKRLKAKMVQGASNSCHCGGFGEIVEDLIEHDLLALGPGERLWKLYCFKDSNHPTGLRHRIYTKQKQDGRLALLTFAVHNPPRDEQKDGEAAPRVRSALARVPDLSRSDLDRLIEAMRGQAQTDACEELDLSQHSDLDEQVAWLREEGRQNKA